MWDKVGTVRTEYFKFFMEKEANINKREQDFLYTTK